MALNEGLFKALWRMAGQRPRITGQGQRFSYTVVQTRAGRRIRGSGEGYAVNCPVCGDTRGRLYVNHMYGLDFPGQEPELRGPMNSLCFCQHEQKCIDLRRYLGPYETFGANLSLSQLPQSPESDGVFSRAPDMGEGTPLDQLPPEHQARQYLVQRGYDPDYLARHHHVQVMTGHQDPKIAKMCIGRLVFPFMINGSVEMWQARLAYDLAPKQKFPPKWYFPPNTKKIPWNLDLAAQYGAVIVCEGILSAVNMGPAAISVGGKSLTFETVRRIKERWPCVIVAFDPDAGVAREDLDEDDYQERAIKDLRDAGIPEVYGVQWEPGVRRIRNEKLDPGSLGMSGCMDLLRRSVPQCLDRIQYLGALYARS